MTTLILHKISDSTGETLDVVARACLVQFPDVEVVEKRWTMVRSAQQLDEILEEIQANPGFVIFTLVDDDLSEKISHGCKKLKVPCIDLLNPVLGQMANYLGVAREHRPGSQHVMDADYFSKIAALHFVLAHDDGQSMHDIEDADVILVGVSRTTKTPTCIYLANRGIKAANVPIVPSILDFGRKSGGFGAGIMPTGDVKLDMDYFRDFYAGAKGKFPEKFGPIRLREEDPVDEQTPPRKAA